MSRRNGWGPMSERVKSPMPSPAEAEDPSAAPAADLCASHTAPRPGDPVARVKHCWVVDEHGRLPALLLEWRRTVAGFQGRVVRPVDAPGVGWVVVEEWLPAAMLEPA